MKVMNWILKNSLFLNLLTLFILIFGAYTATNLRREAFPDVNFDTLTVTTVYPGASPDVVELYVTDRLEDELVKVDGVEEVRSSSRENVSSIVLKLEPSLTESEKITARKEIKDAVDRVRDFPKEITDAPLVTEINSGVMPVMEMSLSGDLPYEKLHGIAEDLSDEISLLPDSKTPYKYGFWDKEYMVEADAKKLEEKHVTMDQVVNALAKENLDLPGGVLRTIKGDFLVRTINKLETLKDIESVVIRTNEAGDRVTVGDIGRAIKAFKDSDVLYRAKGQDSITLIIRKSSKGDILTLVNSVKETVQKYKEKHKLDKLQVSYVNDMSVFVRNRLGILANNGFMGLILVLGTLLIFLSRGIALVAALGLPLSFLGTLICMSVMGMTINLLTMFALVIVLGMLVDDSIIVAENIWQHYERGKSPWQATVDGTREVFWPVTATILTTMAAFSPLLMVTGIFGKFISSLPKVVMISLALSLFEAMLILPSHAYDMLKMMAKKTGGRHKPKPPSAFATFFTNAYENILATVLRFRYLFVLMLVTVFASCIWLAKTQMKVILFPEEGVEVFYLRASLPERTPLKVTSEKFQALEKVISKNVRGNELISYVTYVGLQQNDALDPFRERASHLGQIGVFLTPASDRERSANEIIDELRVKIKKVAQRDNFKIDFNKLKVGPPVGSPVAIQIIGKDYDRMKLAAEKIQGYLAQIDGVEDIKNSHVMGLENIRINVLKDKVSRVLVSSMEIGSNIRRTLEGDIATYILKDGDRIPLRVRYKESQRKDENYFKSIVMRNHLNHHVPIKDLITLEKKLGPNTLKHLDGKRIVTVNSSLDEKIVSSSEVNKKMRPHMAQLREEFSDLTLNWGGEYEDTSNSMKSLAEAFGVAIALIFLILATQFKSVTQPLVIMLAIPFGFIGVVITFFLHGVPLSFIGFIGAIGLTGVVVNDSIVLVDFCNKAVHNGMKPFEAMLYAGKRRLRAVLLTSVTTIVGVIPMVYGIGGSDLFLQPAAMALGYGLLFGTVLILLFIPAVYLIHVDIFAWFGKDVVKERQEEEE